MKLKKILSAVAVIGMLACTSAFAASGTITLTTDNTTVAPGDDVDVVLSITSNPGIVGFAGRLSVTGNITMSKKPTNGGTLNGQQIANKTTLPYKLNFIDDGAEENNDATGEIATFHMAIPADAANNDTYTLTFTPSKGDCVDFDASDVDFNTPTLTLTVKKAATTTIGAATKGNNLDGQKTFYAPITIDTSAQTGARFQVSKGDKTKSWEIPSGIVGVANFYAVVKTAETGKYTYNVVSSEGTAIGTAQIVTID